MIKKNRDIVNTKHFQNSIVYYLLFNFLVLFTSFFLFYLSMVFKKLLKFLCCFIVSIRDFIKKFCKAMFFFQKKLRYLKSRFSTKFHRLLFLFYICSMYGIFFCISPNQTCQKNQGIICSVLFEGLEILSTNSGNF